ncbi:D-beta-hydroxybutyrate dehydrogenase, mitochondrial-like [Antedon mediterranea]|uniref:D-beta-hydroxybutyrate dehydrogenase, mitochondrial-like n=1 Tax=Antedon mediterranea TaxID=105859 RepID=UPI003AF9A7B6
MFVEIVLGFTSLIAVFGIASLIKRVDVDPKGKAVLITGCDTGFGYQLSKALDRLGYLVYAGCLFQDGENAKELEKATSSNLTILQLDVTNDKQVSEAFQLINSNLNVKNLNGLWAVVNNAGTSTFGHVEWNTMDTYKFVSEVNLFGTIRITKAFLPLIRKVKGRVINIASGLARQGAAGRSPYVVSKYGVEGFSQCLRYEMKEWGVHVSIIEPGNFVAATNIFTDESISKLSKKMWEEMSEEVQEAYGKGVFDGSVQIMKYYSECGVKDTSPVVNSLKDAVTKKYPKVRYEPKDLYWHVRTFVMLHMPHFISDRLYHF